MGELLVQTFDVAVSPTATRPMPMIPTSIPGLVLCFDDSFHRWALVHEPSHYLVGGSTSSESFHAMLAALPTIAHLDWESIDPAAVPADNRDFRRAFDRFREVVFEAWYTEFSGENEFGLTDDEAEATS